MCAVVLPWNVPRGSSVTRSNRWNSVSGYWIAVDQLAPLTLFHLFDRVTLEPRGTFHGNTTAHTDGVTLHAASMPHFPGGALFAVHDDKAVAAFDLRDVATALNLSTACVD